MEQEPTKVESEIHAIASEELRKEVEKELEDSDKTSASDKMEDFKANARPR